MKKNALAFISALLMSAAVFVSCSDSSDSDPDSPVPGNSVSDGSDSGSAKYVTATAKEDGIHFSIEIPAQFEKWGIGSINIYNETEDEGIVHPEAGVDRNSVSDLMYPLVEPGKTYTFRVAIEPGYDRTVPGWRQDAYNENVTVTAVGGLGEIKAGSVPKAEVTKYEERVETVHERTCNVFDFEGECNCKWHKQTSIYVHYKDSVKENFSYPNGTAKSTDVAAVCVGDAKDDWELYTQWVGGYCDFERREVYLIGDTFALYEKCLAVAEKHGCTSIMIQRRWELEVPSAKGLFFIITSLSEPADVEKVKAESKE